jgi:hypothetical protein
MRLLAIEGRAGHGLFPNFPENTPKIILRIVNPFG